MIVCQAGALVRQSLIKLGRRERTNIRYRSDGRSWQKLSERSRFLARLLVDENLGSDLEAAGECGKNKDHAFHKRRSLSQAITLIESRKPAHQLESNHLLTYLLNSENNWKRKSASFRLGIAGSPGAGKSTFVEAFGKFLLNKKHDSINVQGQPHTMCHKISVVCIDPSSALTGGSILGDKTRMTELARHERAFVRPSPTRNILGGLAAYTEDVVSLCQVAGYDFIIVETVGLGQSEIEVKESVDMLMLMVPPGGGDSLQGIKKGIVEVADMIVVTKADGTLLPAAKHTAADYRGALQMLPSHGTGKTAGWETPPVRLVSSHGEEGLQEIWDDICRFRDLMIRSGGLQSKRREQQTYWFWKNITQKILEQTKDDHGLKEKANILQKKLDQGKTTPRVAASELLESLRKN